ncbi:hypothetical protein [Argonema antarcticum]|uniref:hypothetical protein n=1 Tax=Argonema antarcticum TaxID=2942763 RepID=UPI00201213A5|nr:hypothetical protein [Argonema antarcticum]MCL1474421.1 hypothetical protein [Argonema antarcticum A004/B2]
MPVKKEGRFDLGNNKLASVKIVESNYTALKATLGLDIVDAGAAVPDGKAEVANNKGEAIAVGCFPIAVYYKAAVGGKMRRGIVLCAPSKADTAIKELIGKSFNGKTIVRAMPPRRVKYVV